MDYKKLTDLNRIFLIRSAESMIDRKQFEFVFGQQWLFRIGHVDSETAWKWFYDLRPLELPEDHES